jgi:flagellin
MRIRTNVPSLIAQRNMEQNNSNVSTSMERLSTGYRINRSADDAAGLAISENLRAQIRGLNVAKRNANDAVSMVQVAEGSMNEMTNILIRLRELTVQSASDTLGARERSYLNREYGELVHEFDRIGKATEFNGNHIFTSGDDRDEFVIQVGTNGSSPEANLDTVSINLSGLRTLTLEGLQLSRGDEIGPSVVEAGETQEPTRDQIASKLTLIDDGLTNLANERATLGSIQSRLTSAISNIGVTVENQEMTKSRVKDIDFASESAALTQNRILVQSTLSMLAQANQMPEMALSLLRP